MIKGILSGHTDRITTSERNIIRTKEHDGIPVTIAEDISYIEEISNGACGTIDCLKASLQIRSSIDASTNPCSDFYQFACGNSKKNPFIVDVIRLNLEVKEIIENKVNSAGESKVFDLVRTFYKSCTNQAEIEAIGLKQFSEITRKIGGCPLIEGEQWNETAYDWIESIRAMRDVGSDAMYLFAAGVRTNFKNSSIHSLVVTILLHFIFSTEYL